MKKRNVRNRQSLKAVIWCSEELAQMATTFQKFVTGEAAPASNFRHWLSPGWWTLIFAMVVAFMFWLGGVYNAPVARASDSVPLCADGQEYDAGLCYPKCKDGYNGVGPVCWQK